MRIIKNPPLLAISRNKDFFLLDSFCPYANTEIKVRRNVAVIFFILIIGSSAIMPNLCCAFGVLLSTCLSLGCAMEQTRSLPSLGLSVGWCGLAMCVAVKGWLHSIITFLNVIDTRLSLLVVSPLNLSFLRCGIP